MRRRPMRWRHIPGTIWGERRAELWRGDCLLATVWPGKVRGSRWRAGSVALHVAFHESEWSSQSFEVSKVAAKAYVVEQLKMGESDS
jgi:hypothetical protein